MAASSALLVALALACLGAGTGLVRADGAAGEAAGAAAPREEPDDWVVLETDVGEIWINVFEERTPAHAENFKKLVRLGWYDGSPFPRVIPGFVAQGGGHWTADGRTRDVGYTLPPEIRGSLRHVRGAVAAARQGDQQNPGRRSSGSQFYICLLPQPELDLQYTIFGQVILGLDVLDALRSAAPGQDGALRPEQASVVRRAFIRPANAAGSAATTVHDHDHH